MKTSPKTIYEIRSLNTLSDLDDLDAWITCLKALVLLVRAPLLKWVIIPNRSAVETASSACISKASRVVLRTVLGIQYVQ